MTTKVARKITKKANKKVLKRTAKPRVKEAIIETTLKPQGLQAFVPLRRGRPEWPAECFENLMGMFDPSRVVTNRKGYSTLGILNTTFGLKSDGGKFHPLFGIQHMVQVNEERNEIRLIGPNSEREDFSEEDSDIEDVTVWNTAWIALRPQLVSTVRYMLSHRKGLVPISEANRRLTTLTTQATGLRGRYSPFYSGRWKNKGQEKTNDNDAVSLIFEEE